MFRLKRRIFSYQFEEKEKLYQENENLKSELNHQRDITVDYYNIKRENERFKKYYDIKESDNSLKFVSASVIGRDQTDIFGDFVLDKGKSSGIVQKCKKKICSIICRIYGKG